MSRSIYIYVYTAATRLHAANLNFNEACSTPRRGAVTTREKDRERDRPDGTDNRKVYATARGCYVD